MENMTYEKMSMYNQSLFVYIKDGVIYNQTGGIVGRTEDRFQSAMETAKGFQNKLIEAGILQVPKTPEQINQELQDTLKKTQAMMVEMSTAMLGIKEKVTALEEKENVKQGNDFESGKQSDVARKDSVAQPGFRNNK